MSLVLEESLVGGKVGMQGSPVPFRSVCQMVVDIGLKDCEGNKEASLTVYCVSLISYGLQEVMSARMGVRKSFQSGEVCNGSV